MTELQATEVEHSRLGTIYVFKTEDGTVVGWWRKPVTTTKPLTMGEHLSLMTPTQRIWLAITLIFLIVVTSYGVLVDSLIALFWIGSTLAMLGPDMVRRRIAKKRAAEP